MRGAYSSKYSNFLLLTIVLFNLLCAVGPPGLPIGQKAEALNKEFYKILSQNHTKQRREPNSCLREMIVEIEKQSGNIVSLKNSKEICESTLPHFRVCAPLKCPPLNFPLQSKEVVAMFQCQLDSFCIKLRVSERMSFEQSAFISLSLNIHLMLDKITQPFDIFQQKISQKKVISTEVPAIRLSSMFLQLFLFKVNTYIFGSVIFKVI